ncbi:hypothetical protein HaLaN_02089, partial [Haematococcus lacustris]
MGDLPEKVGAGFLFVSGGSALLLKRSSKHNDQASPQVQFPRPMVE